MPGIWSGASSQPEYGIYIERNSSSGYLGKRPRREIVQCPYQSFVTKECEFSSHSSRGSIIQLHRVLEVRNTNISQ